MIDGQRCVAVIQARYQSSRLPGKILYDLSTGTSNHIYIQSPEQISTTRNVPVLISLLKRVATLSELDAIVVAVAEQDDLEILNRFFTCYQIFEKYPQVYLFYDQHTDPNNVLSRIVRAAEEFGAKVVMRISGDCPLWCASIGKAVLYDYFMKSSNCCYTTATNIGKSITIVTEKQKFKKVFVPYTQCPNGTDTEVMSFDSLAALDKQFVPYVYREHPTLSYYSGYCGYMPINTTFRIPGITSSLKLSIDTEYDMQNVSMFYNHLLKYKEPNISLRDAIGVVRDKS